MPKIKLLPGTAGTYYFYCPGCKTKHTIHTKDEGFLHPIWGFNGDVNKPTFSPSLLSIQYSPEGVKRCHSFIRDGKIEYLQDSDHSLAGKTVEMEEITDGKENSSTD